MNNRLAGYLLAELAVRPDTASGLMHRLGEARGIDLESPRYLELHLRALQREGKVRNSASATGDVAWSLAEPSRHGHTPDGGSRAQVRPALEQGLHILDRLRDLALTPAGNPRPGATGVEIRWRGRTMTLRVEVVDEREGAQCFWLCLRVSRTRDWMRLHATAETPSPGWMLPWLVATKESADLPSLLAWRSVDLDGVVDAIIEVGDALRFGSLADVTVATIKTPRPAPDRSESVDGAAVGRLLRRRGPIPPGRKYPVRGTCDRCGQPLSDPYSLLIGVGPVCRQHYPPQVIAAVARGAVTGASSGTYTRSPTDALLQLAQAWAHAAV